MRSLILAALALPLTACHGHHHSHARPLARAVIARNCAACHTVPGVATARGRVGPVLAGIGRQQVIGGHLANSRANLIRWITHAQSISPGTAMPDIPLTDRQAGAVADYLLTLDDRDE